MISVGGANLGILWQDVGIPGHDRDAGRDRRLQGFAHGRSVRGRYRNAVDLLADQILDDLDLLQLGVLARADVDALDVGELVLGLVAAVAGQIEEGIVHGLGHERELELVGRNRGAGNGEGGKAGGE